MFRPALLGRAAAALTLFAALASCSNSSTAPAELNGSYRLVAADGAYVPVRFEPLYNVLPYTWITGGTMEVVTDSMHLILHLQDKDASGTVVGTPPDIDQWIKYTRSGDSLIVTPASTSEGGQFVTPDVRYHAAFPAHPSTGLTLILHTLYFQH
jgi:hypothetical protein